MEDQNKEKKRERNHYLLPYRISMITGKTRNDLYEEALNLEEGMIPVTDVIEVNMSKLGCGIKNEYMQVYARLKDYVAADLKPKEAGTNKPSDEELTKARNQR